MQAAPVSLAFSFGRAEGHVIQRATIVLLVSTSPCFASSYARPERHDVFSHNQAFVLDVNPETKVHTVYDARDRTKPLWSFSMPVWHFPFLLSNDGRVIVTVTSMYVKAEDIAESVGVRFWNRDSEFRTYPLRDLCPDPPKTQDVGVGPIGGFWRTWYTDVNDDGEAITIRTTCDVEYRFRLADGKLIERRRLGWRAWGENMPVIVGGLAVGSLAATLWWYWRRRRKRLKLSGAAILILPAQRILD
jgi:hypothetical protein